MSRKAIVRNLPDLKTVRLRDGDHKEQHVFESLRAAALHHRNRHAQPFYAVREVSRAFAIPISSVSRVYGRLEREGLVTRIRGSHTLLRGVSNQRTVTIQGIIAMPAALSCFLTLLDYRLFFLTVRRTLRTRGFVTLAIYFDESELRDGSLADRLKLYQVDTVVWYLPGAAAQNTIRQLHDMGIRVIGIADGGLPAILCHYGIHRERALRQVLRTWRSVGRIERVTVVLCPGRSSRADQERLEELLITERFEFDTAELTDRSLDTLVSSLSSPGVIIMSPAGSLLGFRKPDLLKALLQQHRVAFLDGAIAIPFAALPNARCDIVSVDWQTVAERLAQDLTSVPKNGDIKRVSFDAKALLNVPVSTHFQSF